MFLFLLVWAFQTWLMLFNFRCLQILLFNKKKKIRKGSVDSDVIMWLRESGSYEKHRILWEFVMLRVIPLSSSWNRKWSKTFYSQLPFQRCCPIPWCPSCCKRYLDCAAFGVFFYGVGSFLWFIWRNIFLLAWWNLHICGLEALRCSLGHVWGWSLVEASHSLGILKPRKSLAAVVARINANANAM